MTLAVLLYILSLLKLARLLLLISNYRQKLSKKDKACHKEIASTTHATSNMTYNSPPLYYVGNTAKCDSSHRDNQPISRARSLSRGKSNLEALQTRGIQNEPTRIWRSHVRSHSQPHHPETDPWNASSSPGPYYLRLSSSQPRDPILNPPRSLCGPVTLQQPVPTINKLQTKAVISLKFQGIKQRSSQGSSKLTSVAVGR